MASARVDSRVNTVTATVGYGPDKNVQIQYTNTKVIGHGSFGVVYQAKIIGKDDFVAIKKVLQDKRYKNRELQIMRSLQHQNIVELKYFFYSTTDKKEEVFLNLVLAFIPETLVKAIKRCGKTGRTLPVILIKLFIYQLFRALGYIHYCGVCHRDLKPQNILVDCESGELKICDFGSAKQLIRGEVNVSYICSRYYRAPELIFGSTQYNNSIDVWSAGCVFAETFLGQPIFQGDSGVDQLVEIIRILGTPTREQVLQMNPDYVEFNFPNVTPHPWNQVFPPQTPVEAINLISRLLIFIPTARLTPLDACCHNFFDEIRKRESKLPNGRPLPPLFNFTEKELQIQPALNQTLIPPHARENVVRSSTESA